jgi:hypothetical protein
VEPERAVRARRPIVAGMTQPRDGAARLTRGLVGFYVACTVFGVAITITAVAWIVFPTVPGAAGIGWFGVALCVLAAAATWHYLGVTRRER